MPTLGYMARRCFSQSYICLFRKEELYQRPKVPRKIDTLKPVVPELTVPEVEYTFNGLTLKERRFLVENAPNPKDNQVLPHLFACPDWNTIIPKGIDHLKTGVSLPDGISDVIIQIGDNSLPYNHPLNYLMHCYLPPLVYANGHIKFFMENVKDKDNHQLVVKYRTGDEITINASVATTGELLQQLASTFGIKSFNTPVTITA